MYYGEGKGSPSPGTELFSTANSYMPTNCCLQPVRGKVFDEEERKMAKIESRKFTPRDFMYSN